MEAQVMDRRLALHRARRWRWIVREVLVSAMDMAMHERYWHFPCSFGNYTITLCLLCPPRHICWRRDATQKAFELVSADKARTALVSSLASIELLPQSKTTSSDARRTR